MILYHITTNIEFNDLCPGDSISTSKELNNFQKGITNSILNNSSHPSKGELIKYSEGIHSNYEDLNALYSSPPIEKEHKLIERSSTFHGLSTDLNNSLFKYLAYVREDIFEKIRRIEFPHRPSRMNGLWLCKSNAVENWWNDIAKEDSKILEIEVDKEARYMTSDSNLITTDTYSIEKFENLARQYWMGTTDDNPINEVLIEGTMVIKKIFSSLEEYKCT